MAELWFCPNIGSPDTLDLFRYPDKWAAARQHVSAFQMYAQHLMAGVDIDVDPNQEPNWQCVGPNTFPSFASVNAFGMVQQWQIPLVIEIGAIKPSCCDAVDNANLAVRLIDRVEQAGGAVSAIAIDESLNGSHSAMWENVDHNACNLSIDDAARATARFALAIKRDHPDVRVGLIEPYPALAPSDILRFVQLMNELGGFHPEFLHLDVDRNAIKDKKLKDDRVISEMDSIGEVCRRAPIPYGQILWGQFFNTEAEYRMSVLKWASLVRRFKIQPTTLILQSWEPCNGSKKLPLNLPDTRRDSHTYLINEIANLFGIH